MLDNSTESYQSCSAGFAADGGGGGAERADGGSTGAPLEGGHPPRALRLGRRGAREADARHLVGRSEQTVPGQALEVPERKTGQAPTEPSALTGDFSLQVTKCYNRRYAESAVFTWSLRRRHHSSQVVHPVPLHTSLPLRSRSLPESALLLPCYHQPTHRKTNQGSTQGTPCSNRRKERQWTTGAQR